MILKHLRPPQTEQPARLTLPMTRGVGSSSGTTSWLHTHPRLRRRGDCLCCPGSRVTTALDTDMASRASRATRTPGAGMRRGPRAPDFGDCVAGGGGGGGGVPPLASMVRTGRERPGGGGMLSEALRVHASYSTAGGVHGRGFNGRTSCSPQPETSGAHLSVERYRSALLLWRLISWLNKITECYKSHFLCLFIFCQDSE